MFSFIFNFSQIIMAGTMAGLAYRETFFFLKKSVAKKYSKIIEKVSKVIHYLFLKFGC
jgi:hypothetical protein